MSKTYQDLEAEILLERKENLPNPKDIIKATILAKNSHGIFVDINKVYEGSIALADLGEKSIDSYSIGQSVEVCVLGEEKNQEGVFRLSIKQLDDHKKWDSLNKLLDQNLELVISRVHKSGVEAQITATGQTGFIPFAYLDLRQADLRNTPREAWNGLTLVARIHELDPSRNKIILNHRVVSEEQREAHAQEVLSHLSVGQIIDGVVVRTADFGVFVDIGGLDALIPSAELTWRRFKKPADVVTIGQTIKAKVFRIENDKKRIALSVKQVEADPWTTLPEELKTGHQVKAKVVTHADFGVFVEILPGVEALLHKSNYETAPAIGSELDVEIINVEPAKKRIGVKTQSVIASSDDESNNKELEHV